MEQNTSFDRCSGWALQSAAVILRLFLLPMITSTCLLGCNWIHHRVSPQPHVTPPSPNQSFWLITAPAVNKRLTPYPEVAFQDGDIVTILEAGGCVQTGGYGKTWKHYVRPQGKDSGRYYHGLIWLPGATEIELVKPDLRKELVVPIGSGPVRIASAIGKSYVIHSKLSGSENVLHLGYEDDVYHDNGYYGFDIGNPRQCDKGPDGNLPVAYVKLKIERGTAVPASSFKPFDLVADGTDRNGFMLNPRWYAQNGFLKNGAILDSPLPKQGSAHEQRADLPDADISCQAFPEDASGFAYEACTTQAPSYDYPINFSLNKTFSCPGTTPPGANHSGVHGHVNWGMATLTGRLSWSGDQAFDEDAAIFLTRPISAQDGSQACEYSGYTSAYDDQIEVEAAGYETFDTFMTKGWFDDWHHHDRGHWLSDEAIVVGLFGLDCVHGCKPEVHPAPAIAARVPQSLKFENGSWDDRWMIMVRSNGNEGWCSHDPHFLNTSQLTFELPGPPSATAVDVVKEPNDDALAHPAHTANNAPPDDDISELRSTQRNTRFSGPNIERGKAVIHIHPSERSGDCEWIPAPQMAGTGCPAYDCRTWLRRKPGYGQLSFARRTHCPGHTACECFFFGTGGRPSVECAEQCCCRTSPRRYQCAVNAEGAS